MRNRTPDHLWAARVRLIQQATTNKDGEQFAATEELTCAVITPSVSLTFDPGSNALE